MHAICQEMTLDLRTVIVFLEIFYLVFTFDQFREIGWLKPDIENVALEFVGKCFTYNFSGLLVAKYSVVVFSPQLVER